jgi:hypothetical protein
MESGIGTPILEDTRPLDYIEWGWIPQIRDFLHHIQGKIIGASPIPRIFRVNDSYIMDSPSLREKSYRERMLIHRCRLFLQVETLSDIVDMTGTRILEQWKTDHTPKPSASNKKWPLQANPGKEAWKTWKHFFTRSIRVWYRHIAGATRRMAATKPVADTPAILRSYNNATIHKTG